MSLQQLLAAQRVTYRKPIVHVIEALRPMHIRPEDVRIFIDYPYGWHAIIDDGVVKHLFTYNSYIDDWNIESINS